MVNTSGFSWGLILCPDKLGLGCREYLARYSSLFEDVNQCLAGPQLRHVPSSSAPVFSRLV